MPKVHAPDDVKSLDELQADEAGDESQQDGASGDDLDDADPIGADDGTPPGDKPDADEGEGEGAKDDTGEDDEEVVITLGDKPAEGDEPDDSRAPNWVRELRRTNRALMKERYEKEQEIQRLRASVQPQAEVIGEKPKLADFDFDEDKFEAALTSWHDKRRQVEQQREAQERQAREAAEAWAKRQQTYREAAAKLPVKDFEVAEDTVKTALSEVQQGVILHGAERPELLVYVLGKNPAKARELAAINDPVKFAFAVAKLEAQVKVTPKSKTPPPPERAVRSSVAGAAAVDNQLEKLRAEAQKTGDMTKLMAYRRQLRAKQAA